MRKQLKGRMAQTNGREEKMIKRTKTRVLVSGQILKKCLFLLVAMSFLASFLLAGQEKANYDLAARWTPAKVGKLVFNLSVEPHWLVSGDRFWYVYETPAGKDWYLVEAARGSCRPLFDKARMASDLTRILLTPYDAQHLPIKTIKMIKEMKLESQCEFISFSLNICKEIKKLAPTFKVQYLRGELSPEQVKAEGLDGLDYHYSVFLKNPTWIAEAKNLGLVTNVWTVNDEAVFKQLSEMGVDFVTTNIPDVLSKK